MTLHVFSYGGGVQSTAALVLAAQGKIDFSVFLFANVGDDSEHPDTLRYVHEVAMPYAISRKIELVEIRKKRNGVPRTLYAEVTDPDLRGIPIPIYGKDTGPALRSCTKHYKVIPISRETKRRGATKDNPAVIGLGISIDEYQRMRNDSPIAWQVFSYPLIDLRLSRIDCKKIITSAGLPIPPKSACWFCPFTGLNDWRRMKERQPDLFMNAVVLEQDILAKRQRNGHDPAYLSRLGIPLHQAFEGHQSDMFEDEDACESGFCMT